MTHDQPPTTWGKPYRPLLIASIGSNHDGNTTTALELVDAAKAAGCDLVRFSKRASGEPDLRFEDWKAIDEHCRLRGIEWFASSGDVHAFRLLSALKVRRHALSPALLRDPAVTVSVLQRRFPCLLPVRLADSQETTDAASTLRRLGGDLGIARAPLSSPTRPAQANLLAIRRLQQSFEWASIGFASHEPGDVATLGAVALGASFVERQITLDRNAEGPEHARSLEPDELRRLVTRIHELEAALGDAVDVEEERRPALSIRPRSGDRGFCGLDFGTSNSEIGIVADGEPLLAPLDGGLPRMPSTIFFDPTGADPLFGSTAVERYLSGDPGRLFWSLKGVLGTPLMMPPSDQTRVYKRTYKFGEIIGLMLGHLKRSAERVSGRPLTQVVLGRPVRFSDDSDELDRIAASVLEESARQQGFEDVLFEYEPVAAALHHEQGLSREALAVVADIGGGTSDFSVVRLGPERRRQHDRRADVLAVGGVHLGGTDFDRALSLRHLMESFGRGAPVSWHRPAVATPGAVRGAQRTSALSHRPAASHSPGAPARPLHPARPGGPSRGVPGSHGRPRSAEDRHGTRMPDWIYQDLSSWLRIGLIQESPRLDEIYKLVRVNEGQEPRLSRLDTVLRQHLGHRVAQQVEGAKIALSSSENSDVELPFVEPGLRVAVSRSQLEEAIRDRLNEIERGLARTLETAGIEPSQVEVVVLTGGAAAVPAVRSAVQRCCPAAPIGGSDQFGGIALGLTLRAAREFGEPGSTR